MKTNPNLSALIIARPGRMRESLSALLVATSQFGRVDCADDLSSALQRPAEPPPALALVDVDLPGPDVEPALKQIKAVWPNAQYLVLVEAGQEQLAQKSGADGILRKGFRSTELFAMIAFLLGGEANHRWSDPTHRLGAS
jgi:DNA-binding NarL/FixJ family response regulator